MHRRRNLGLRTAERSRAAKMRIACASGEGWQSIAIMHDPDRVRPTTALLVPTSQPGRNATERGSAPDAAGGAPRRIVALGVLGLATLLADGACAESMIRLPRLDEVPRVAATTFEPGGKPVGQSSFTLEKLAAGLQKMTVHMGLDTGAQNVSEVTLAPAARGASEALQIVEERSQSTRADGTRLDLLVVDHVAGRASCIPDAGGAAKARHVELPDPDRVVNVPMQLLFQPLVAGEVDEVRFQIVLCTGGPRVQDMIAMRGPRHALEGHEGREVIEIRYGPDFGSTVAFFASRLLPSLSFWFDAKDGSYLGHRMPLHTKGPDIVLVRSGLTPRDLGLE